MPSKSEATVWFGRWYVGHFEMGSKRRKAPMTLGRGCQGRKGGLVGVMVGKERVASFEMV